MYTVMIVDDEKPARLLLEKTINWASMGFKIEYSLKNGQEAYEKYLEEKPNLIITDIQMPVMDGLQLIKEIRKNDKEQKFIILSCHESFNYAREAIRNGVMDYLIKDLVTPEEVYGLLLKMSVDFEDKKVRLGNMTDSNGESDLTNYFSSVLKDMLFNDVSDFIKDEYDNIINKRKGKLYFSILTITIDDFRNEIKRLKKEQARQRIENIRRLINTCINTFYGGGCIYNDDGEFIAIACVSDISSKSKHASECQEIAHKIRTYIKLSEMLSVTICVSSGFNSVRHIRQKYNESSALLKFKMFIGKGNTILYNSYLPKVIRIEADAINVRVNNIRKYLEENDKTTLLAELDKLYINDLKGFMQFNYLKYVNSAMFRIIIEYIGKNGISNDEVFKCDYIPIEEVEGFETINEINEWFQRTFLSIIETKKSSRNYCYSKRVRDAVNYIEKNYHSEIGLNEISGYLGIHKNYLCRLFKQETGENITEYIIRYRIEKAKRLIEADDKRLYEIAEIVGFTNSQQFSQTFKRIVGMTAIQYRNK